LQRITDCRLHSCDSDGLIEFHRYNVNESCRPIFDDHEDDYGGVHFAVNTVIYYLRKDPTVRGGDLIIKSIQFDVAPTDDKIQIVCFSGDVTHRVTPMIGQGVRECIVVQLKCTNRSYNFALQNFALTGESANYQIW